MQTLLYFLITAALSAWKPALLWPLIAIGLVGVLFQTLIMLRPKIDI